MAGFFKKLKADIQHVETDMGVGSSPKLSTMKECKTAAGNLSDNLHKRCDEKKIPNAATIEKSICGPPNEAYDPHRGKTTYAYLNCMDQRYHQWCGDFEAKKGKPCFSEFSAFSALGRELVHEKLGHDAKLAHEKATASAHRDDTIIKNCMKTLPRTRKPTTLAKNANVCTMGT